MVDKDRDVIVIGGGISGLTAAWHLKYAGVDVCLLESEREVGGVTRTERRDGFLLEKGPFNVIVRDPAFEALLEGMADEVKVISASKAARMRYLYRGGRLLAVPSSPVGLVTTPLLSMRAKCRLLSGLIASRRSDGHEETIEQVAVRRVGKEATDTMVSALIAGILAGDIRRLSLRACFPSIALMDLKARSLIAYGLRSAFRSRRCEKGFSHQGFSHQGFSHQGSGHRRWRGLVSLEGGLGVLTEALGRSLGSDQVSNCRVEEIRSADVGYEVVCREGDSRSRSLRCRRLILAPPAGEAARLLDSIVPDAAKILRTIESVPLVVLNLGFKKADVAHPLEGFGFLVPHDEPGFPLLGILWADSIFPHHAPPDHRLIRVFIGGSRDPDAAGRSDSELLATAMDASRDLLHLSGEPMLVDVCRYEAAIPQYGLGYLDKIARLHSAMSERPNLHLVGNYLEGVSLNDCVRCATRVAWRIIAMGGKTDDVEALAVGGAS